MSEFLRIGGSFAITWLVLWLFCAFILLSVYPLLRSRLLIWHPSIASRILLLLLAFPFLLSLGTTVMLFLPATEGSLVSAHCHENCQIHVPLLQSTWLAGVGLLSLSIILTVAVRKLLFNVVTARKLMTDLLGLSSDAGSWHQIPDPQPVVFTLGWWRNRIFVTEGLLQQCDAKDMDIILHHELAHGNRFDNLRLLLARIFLLVLPSTLAAKLYADLHFLTESACDFIAAKKFGELDVAETLLRVQKLVPEEFSYGNNSFVSAFTGAEIERRIRNLVAGNDQFVNFQYGQTICFLVLTLLSFALVDPLHHSIEWLLALY